MKILYIFPHPDDESFGPAPAISAQVRTGHEVYLLTLTKGEATKQRHRLGLGKAEISKVRFREMQCVEKVLGLAGMTVIDLPDGELKSMDPITIEERIKKHIDKVRPDVLVTYAVHGISGFHDHLVCHAVVKRLFSAYLRSDSAYPKRLALFTRMGEVDLKGAFRLEASKKEEIDCIVECDESDMQAFHKALDCYETYTEVIEKSGVRTVVDSSVPFEFFMESFEPPLKQITDRLR